MNPNLKEAVYASQAILEARTKRLKTDSRISEANKKYILTFIADKQSEGIEAVRAGIILQHLRRIAAIINKPFTEQTDTDIRELMRKIESSPWSDWTKSTSKTLIKNILKKQGWQRERYEWIKSGRPVNRLRSEDLLTDEEMNRMVAATDNPMYKALIGVLCDTGMRPGELLTMQVKDVHANGTKYKLYVSGKTSKKTGSRVCYVYKAIPLLKAWLTIHPHKNEPEAPLWLNIHNQPVNVADLSRFYTKNSKRAGIHKRNNPYLIRHTKLTEFYRDFGAVLGAKLAGHVIGSRESRTYTHLSETDLEDALDRKHGVKEDKPNQDLQLCPRCKHLNTYAELTCQQCGTALNSAGALIVEQDNTEEQAVLQEIKNLLSKPDMINKLQKLLETTQE